jgi:hypothetical protein
MIRGTLRKAFRVNADSTGTIFIGEHPRQE